MVYECTTIEQLENHVEGNHHDDPLDRRIKVRNPRRVCVDPWKIPQKKWFAFSSESVTGCSQARYTLIKSLGVELDSTLADFREFSRLQRMKRRGSVTPEEEDSLVQLHLSYKQGKKLENAERTLKDAGKRMATEES